MRVIEPEQLAAELARALLRQPVVGRPDQEPPPRPFFGRVRQRHRMRHTAVRRRPARRSTRAGRFPRRAAGSPHRRRPQSFSRRHHSSAGPERFGQILLRAVRETPSRPPLDPSAAAATCSAAASAAPDEMPTSNPSSRASRRTMRMRLLGADAQILVGQRRVVDRRHHRRRHVLQPLEAVKRASRAETRSA